MFGNDENQNQGQDNNGPLNAAMPDPINYGEPVAAAADNSPGNDPTQSSPAPTAPDYNTPEIPATGTPDPASGQTSDTGDNDDLANLKQQALQHLSPLISHLDQTAEEKFRTTMMMIQASDDQSLIKPAFEAAQLIGDDKARAQALLDVINEINYFTQRHQ